MRFKIPTRQPTSFRASALYLAGRSHGHQPTRVAWMFSRNLETEEPSKAAARMEALAAQNTRCKSPRYHFILTFDPADAKKGKLPPEALREIAQQTIERLGLSDHQILVYAHKDTEHPHIHFLVNRIHPQSLRAWSRMDEGRRLTALCREIAKERGLNVARDLAAERKQQDRGKAVDDAEYRIAKREEREPVAPFDRRGIHELRAAVRDDFFAAASWDDLSGRLADKGYSLIRKGQGLIITDGERAAKLSDLGKGIRFQELERRFDLPFDVWHSQQISRAAVEEVLAGPKTTDRMSPDERVRTEALHRMEQIRREGTRDPIEVLDTVDQDYLYWSSVQSAYQNASRRVVLEQRKQERIQADMTRQQVWENRRYKEMMAALGSIFVDAERARSAWLKLELAHGAETADAMIRHDASILGEMKGTDIAGRKSAERRVAEKTLKVLQQRRRQWRAARDKVAAAFSRIERQRRALGKAVAEYEALQRAGGDSGWIKSVMIEKVKARARALDRVTGDMIHKARLADERKAQLHRAWRRHQERRRQRERERQTRGLGF
ncbi:MAG: relaxase/mobilization nuclease domain-containing protein, partial [Hyphomicrobiales bacterium]